VGKVKNDLSVADLAISVRRLESVINKKSLNCQETLSHFFTTIWIYDCNQEK
jgi:hypothetical protein